MKNNVESKEESIKNIVDLAQSNIISSILDVLGVNYTIIDKLGNYITENNSTLSVLKHFNINLETSNAALIDDKAWKDCENVMRSGERALKEEFFRDKYFLSIKQPLIDKDECLGILVLSIDITERKLAEEREKQAIIQAAEEKIKAEAEAELRQAVMILTGSIVHDLKTPLAGLKMKGHIMRKYWPVLIDAYHKARAAQLLIEGDNPDIARRMDLIAEIGNDLEQTSQQMQGFVEATLKTLSKAMRGTLAQEDLTLCSVWHCIASTLNYYSFVEDERSLVKWEQKYNFDFMGNEVLLVRVLTNLLTNALYQIKENKRGHIILITEDGGTVNLLKFRDTAGGAAPEVVERLFTGYQTTKQTGTGVGLAFCKLTLQSFGGDITCHSVQGDYIEFVLSFPKVVTKA